MRIKSLKLSGFKFSFRNLREFLTIYKEVFVRPEYKPQIKSPKPFILDCGSHIGITVLYFKKLFPDSKVVAFEPNPELYEILKLNVSQNNLKNVEPLNVALFDRVGEIDFYITKKERLSKNSTWGWGGAAVKNKWLDPRNSKTIKAKSVRLSDFIKGKVDLIKLDIEGAETRVLREIEDRLHLVREIILEFHGNSTNPENKIEDILRMLKSKSFSYTITQRDKLVDEAKIKKADPYWLIIHAIKN